MNNKNTYIYIICKCSAAYRHNNLFYCKKRILYTIAKIICMQIYFKPKPMNDINTYMHAFSGIKIYINAAISLF